MSVARILAPLVLLAACKRGETDPVDAGVAPASEPAAPSAVSEGPTPMPATVVDAGSIEGAVEALRVPRPSTPPREHSAPAGGKIDIPGGSYPAGSVQGDDGRDPLTEPMQVPMELTPFSIDALPFPGEPGTPPRIASAGEAAQACSERGGRLCNEWEWERACRGPELDVYASGEVWDTSCEKEPASCVSGYGVRAMGVSRELTGGAMRGAVPLPSDWKSETGAHRCARRAVGGDGMAAFRCCYGAAQTQAKMPDIPEYPSFRSFKMDDAELAALIGKTPELARIGEGVRFLTAETASQAYARSETSREGIKFTSAPLLWSPERGVEIVVLTGRSKYHSFVLAFYPRTPAKEGAKDTELRLASSMLFLRDVTPIVLAYRASSRRELLWTSFWGSRTDEGYISWRDDRRVVIVQK